MSLNTPQELLDEGFTPEQFGQSSSAWAAYAQPLLDEINQNIQQRAGVQYASTDAGIQNHIKRAERFAAAAELWDRRMNRDEAESSIGQEINKDQTNRFTQAAAQYRSKAKYELAQIPAITSAAASATSAPAVGAIASSHFAGPLL